MSCHRSAAGFAFVPFLLLLAGCGGDDASSAPPAPPLLEVTPELRIGSLDGPGTTLTYVTGMAVHEGRIYSAHRRESSILVHGPDGERLARIGRTGEGPGEFRGLGAIGFLGDTLWARDFQLSRLSYFTPRGQLIRTITIPIRMPQGGDGPLPPGSLPPRPAAVLPDGRIMGASPAPSRAVAAGTITEIPIVTMDTLGDVLDTLYMQELANWAIQDPTGTSPNGAYRGQPFDDTRLRPHSQREPAFVLVDRAVESDASTTYRVTRITFAGDTVFDRTFAYDPVPIDPAYPDSLIEAFATRVAGSGAGNPSSLRDAMTWARENLYLPAHYPPVEAAIVGLDETVWLRMAAPHDAETVEWLVLDAGGEPTARVRMPARFRLREARADRAWGWALDELDVPYIYRYGIGEAGD